ncbi:hypothetical protein FA15DRAFT_657497 [Coprinopsis marcescibilis]|uniref:Uncharacterized protein n=1 Tax=Coprinopsis marcescibilis TaxID=230819 RepID=A0A5C3KPM1_COPMA|nr:hypothetical protein FA15DRAFT_657497 [Coprinopsis marcescibilis]
MATGSHQSSIFFLGFEWLNDTHREVICRICSDRPGAARVSKFRWTSRHSHLATKVHIKAVESAGRGHSEQLESNPGPQPPQSAILRWTIASHLDEVDTRSDDEAQIPETLHGVFFEDGRVFQDGTEITFSAGGNPDAEWRKKQKALRTQLENLYLYQEEMATRDNGLDEADDERDQGTEGLSSVLEAMQLLDRPEEDPSDQYDEATTYNEEWAPYSSKAASFQVHKEETLPRLRLSDDHLKAIIWTMHECGTPDVPSLSSLRKTQAKLTNAVGIHQKHHTSSLGNHFYMNHPAKLLALDWANPFVRKNMAFYPEVSRSKPVAEMWQADKWVKEVPYDELSPMWFDEKKAEKKHYYIKEITEHSDGSFVVPMRWVTKRGVVHAQSYILSYSKTTEAFSLADPELVDVLVTDLWRNVLDLKLDSKIKLRFSTIFMHSWMSSLPNPLRIKANGCPMYRLRVAAWSDDVSGNISKQYNPHTNLYIQNLGIPHKKLSQEYFVRFCSTSSYASSSEQFTALRDDFDKDVWHEAYDCQNQTEVLFQILPHVLPADNPQQSEHASHVGPKGLSNCRRDKMGGHDKEKETDEGYAALFKPGTPRQPHETIELVKAQVRLACYGKREDLQLNASQSGVKDKISQHWINKMFTRFQDLQTEKMKDRQSRDPRLNSRLSQEERKRILEGIRQNIQHDLWNQVIKLPVASVDPAHSDNRVHYSLLLDMEGIDPHADMPVEILHTWLLGNEKYLWYDTSKGWSKIEEELFAVRLQSSDLMGLTTPPPRASYLVQYKNSLIGKHFKILQQLGIFHIHGLCPDSLFNLWKAAGELGAMLWISEIEDMDEYLDDLQVFIDNLLDLWSIYDPMRIITKAKLHVLTHLVEDIRRFGPAILYSTEVFECWNAVFRICSILSNHLSPSKDISATLAEMERFKHIISSGWWKDKDGEYIQAGKGVRALFANNKDVQRRLGWSSGSEPQPGSIKLCSLPNLRPVTSVSLGLDGILGSNPTDEWVHCKHIVSQSGDICCPNAWVFVNLGEQDPWFFLSQQNSVARVTHILARKDQAPSNRSVRVVVKRYSVSGTRHKRLNMPILNPENEVLSLFPSISMTSEFVLQERIGTNIPKPVVQHSDLPIFVINMHSLHNAHLVRKVLPRGLVAPVPCCQDRVASRKAAAVRACMLGPKKRADTQKKAKETRARKKGSNAMSDLANPNSTITPSIPEGSRQDVDIELDDDDDDELYGIV